MTAQVARQPHSERVPMLRGVDRPRVWLVGVAVLSVLAWVIFIRPVRPLDFDVFLGAGRAVADGQNPYPALGTPAVWSGSAFVYPWLTAWVFAPATAISAHTAAIVMTATSCAAIAAGVWCLCGWRLVPFGCVLFAAPTLDGLQMGTLNAILFLGVCLVWRWRESPPLAGVTVAVLVTLKVLCWPLAVWLLLTRRWIGVAWALGVSALLLGAGWVFGPMGAVSYGQLLSQLSAHEAATSSGLQGVLVRWSLPVAGAELIGLACAIALTALAARRGDAMTFAATVVVALLASPVVWHHYYLLAAAPLLLIRNGAWWYLVIGWASVAARDSYGVSWHLLPVAATGGLAIVSATMIWRRRGLVVSAVRRPHPVWVATFVLAAIGITVIIDAIGVHAFVTALAPSLVSVGASVAVLVIAIIRTDPGRRRDAERPAP